MASKQTTALDRALARARSPDRRAQLLLEAAGKARKPAETLELCDRVFREYPDDDLAVVNAHLMKPAALVALGRRSEALEAFRAALRAQARIGWVSSYVHHDFGELVLAHGPRSALPEVVRALRRFGREEEVGGEGAVPAYVFAHCSILARAHAALRRRTAAAQYARRALEMALVRRSPFANHPGMGLVTRPDRAELAILKRLAKAL
jgi:tetratricopeptide (TPR) repeat protein